MKNRTYFAAILLMLPFLACAAQAGSVNGMQQAYVCDATTNQGNNCLKPNSDGSINTTTTSGTRTIVPLDVSTVTTGGTAVTALTAGHRTAGGFLYNPIGATINLCINEQATASGTTSAAGLTCIQPGQTYSLAPSSAAVSVITSDSSHPFSGQGLN